VGVVAEAVEEGGRELLVAEDLDPLAGRPGLVTRVERRS
jgi:hypothetical protein